MMTLNGRYMLGVQERSNIMTYGNWMEILNRKHIYCLDCDTVGINTV
jgi:hypothetical protein